MRRAAATLLAPALLWAQTPEELKAIEESLAADRAAPTAAPAGPTVAVPQSPLNIALVLDVAGAWFSDPPEQLGAHDPPDTGATLQQLELNVNANVDHALRFDANLVFSLFGVELEEAFGTTLALPGGLQARVGQFLTRFGRLNPTHPHSWAFFDQPLVNGKMFGGEGSRGVGAELSWLLPLPWYVELVASGTNADGACCARSFLGAQSMRVEGAEDLLYTTTARQFFDLAPAWGLAWGVSAQLGPNASGQGNRSEVYGSDLYLRYRPRDSARRSTVSLTLEVMHRRRQAPSDVLADSGGYAQLVWNIDPRWSVGGRYGYVEGLDADPLDPDWTEARQRASLQATFNPSHFSRLRLQGSYDDRQWLDDPVWAVLLGVELLVGAHGAHNY